VTARLPELDGLAALFRLPVIRLDEMRACQPAFELVPYADALRRKLALLRAADGALFAALSDPYDTAAQDWIEENVPLPFSYRLAPAGDIDVYLSQQEQALSAMQALEIAGAQDGASRGEVEEVSISAISESESPVVKLVTSTLYDALKCGASDIHLETSARGLVVKYRIDGVLAVAKTVDGVDVADQVISRVKVMSELDIAERRVPQDGRFKARREGREIDLRVSVMPSVQGEDAVLRILDKRAIAEQLTLEVLGFSPGLRGSLRQLCGEPHGMLLVTGPTGSGKTTTLYAVISEANDGVDKIVTIEDPVEYQLAGVLQIPVNEKKGLTFARGLRSILRHDPDRILVGEIRDPETAEIAVQSALTGHLVYTTVHANNVFDVIGRFMHMGVDPYNLASALNAVLAQRLVRVICKACAMKGCASCRGSGFRGRKAVAELLVFDDELKDLVAGRAPMRRLKDVARAAGGRTLREAAQALVDAGETTQEEIDRVTVAAR
jgi:general secretion pathway protein E